MRLVTSCTLAMAVALVAAPAAVRAQSETDPAARAEAERFFRAGESAYKSGQYLVAAQAFEEAWRRLPLPAIAFSAAQAHRLQYFVDKDPRRLKRAIELYRVYLERTPEGGRREDAVTSLAELEPIMSRIEDEQFRRGEGPIETGAMQEAATQLLVNTQVPTAKVTIDDHTGGSTLMRNVEPGPHKVQVVADGYFPISQQAIAVDGRLVVVEIELRERPAVIDVRTLDGAAVSVDGRPAGVTPIRPLELPAGKHLIAVTRRGRRAWLREVEVTRGEQLTLEVDLERTGQRRASYWVFGASGATLIAAGAFGGLALASDSDASDLLARRDDEGWTLDDAAEFADLVDQRDDRRTIAFTLLGVGSAIGVAGVIMLVFDNPRAETPLGLGPTTPRDASPDPASPSLVVRPLISPDLAGLGLTGRF